MLNLTPMYIAISIVALLVIATLVFFVKKSKKQKRLSTLAGLSFAFVLAGMFFGEDRLIGYSLMSVGIILAVADIIMKPKKK